VPPWYGGEPGASPGGASIIINTFIYLILYINGGEVEGDYWQRLRLMLEELPDSYGE